MPIFVKQNDKDMNTYPQHIADKANSMIAKGTKMSFEAICEMYMKSEAKTAKKSKTFKAAKGMEEIMATPSIDLHEMNMNNAKKNMPSSMR